MQLAECCGSGQEPARVSRVADGEQRNMERSRIRHSIEALPDSDSPAAALPMWIGRRLAGEKQKKGRRVTTKAAKRRQEGEGGRSSPRRARS